MSMREKEEKVKNLREIQKGNIETKKEKNEKGKGRLKMNGRRTLNKVKNKTR